MENFVLNDNILGDVKLNKTKWGGNNSIQKPWEIIHGPYNSIWWTERGDGSNPPGKVRRFSLDNKNYNLNNSGDIIDLYTLDVGTSLESGMLGMAIHPEFSETIEDDDEAKRYVYIATNLNDNQYAYVFKYKCNKAGTLLYGQETLVEIGSANSNHNGCRLLIITDTIANDGYTMFISTGDGGNSSNSQNLNNLQGKILRIKLDGTIPNDNPFVNDNSVKSEIWTYGHRNPQGLGIRKFTYNDQYREIIYSTEHGASAFDEANVIPHPLYSTNKVDWFLANMNHRENSDYPQPGANYGWPTVEGYRTSDTTGANTVEPIMVWGTTTAVSNLAWVDKSNVPIFNNCLLIVSMGGFTASGSSILGSYSKRLYKYTLSDNGLGVVPPSTPVYIQNGSNGWEDTSGATSVYTAYGSNPDIGGLSIGSERMRDICLGNNGNIFIATGGTSYGDSGYDNIYELSGEQNNIFGDVNKNNKIDIGDAQYISAALAGLPGYDIPPISIGDVNNNNKIDIGDAQYISAHLAGIPGFPIGSEPEAEAEPEAEPEAETGEKTVYGYTDAELKKLGLIKYTISDLATLNTSTELWSVFNHSKPIDADIELLKQSQQPSQFPSLIKDDTTNPVTTHNYRYVYNMGSWWLPGGYHPQPLNQYIIQYDYNLTTPLLQIHGDQLYRLLFPPQSSYCPQNEDCIPARLMGVLEE